MMVGLETKWAEILACRRGVAPRRREQGKPTGSCRVPGSPLCGPGRSPCRPSPPARTWWCRTRATTTTTASSTSPTGGLRSRYLFWASSRTKYASFLILSSFDARLIPRNSFPSLPLFRTGSIQFSLYVSQLRCFSRMQFCSSGPILFSWWTVLFPVAFPVGRSVLVIRDCFRPCSFSYL